VTVQKTHSLSAVFYPLFHHLPSVKQ